SPVHFPLAENLECFTIQHKDAARPFAVGCAQCTNVDAFRAAMNGVRTGIISARKNFFWFDHLNDLRFFWIRLGVDDVNTRRTQPGHDQVTALDVWVWRIRAKRRAARVPPEMMELITEFRHFNLAYLLAVGARLRIDIHNQQRVVEFATRRIKRRNKRIFLWW